MVKEETGYLEYSASKTYSIKIKNIMKIDKVSKENKIDKSKAVNKIIEAYN